MSKYYAVRRGRQSGVIVNTWAECQVLTDGFPGAIFKSFPAHCRTAAEEFADHGCYGRKRKTVRPLRQKGPTTVGENYVPSDDTSIPWEQ